MNVIELIKEVKLKRKKEEKRFKKMKREEFSRVKDDKLRDAVEIWIYGKTGDIGSAMYWEKLSSLSKPCQYVITVNAVDAEINRGGFYQYYFNQSHIHTVAADEALSAIGAHRLAEIVKIADIIYSQMKEVIGNCQTRTKEEFAESSKNSSFSELDKEYGVISEVEQVEKLLVAYIKQNIDCFGD